MLVRKHFPKFRKRQKQRAWKLKHLTKTQGGDGEEDDEGKGKKKKSKMDKKWEHRDEQKNKDYEIFLQELEENPDMQEQVNFYKVRSPKIKNKDLLQNIEKELGELDIEK